MLTKDWIKSSYSKGGADNCVEARVAVSVVQVRDTQHHMLGHLGFDSTEWRAFIQGVQSGEL